MSDFEVLGNLMRTVKKKKCFKFSRKAGPFDSPDAFMRVGLRGKKLDWCFLSVFFCFMDVF